MFELMETPQQDAVIKVIGVGGGGGNAVQYMALERNTSGVLYMILNTDNQALLSLSHVDKTIPIGSNITKGLGAGANPEIGRQAAEEDRDKIREALTGADMVFITAGMGGGTGTGAAPIVAQLAKEMNILTVAVVTKPFGFEGKMRMQVAENGIKELRKYVDSLITIPNNKLLSVLGKSVSLLDAFKAANNVLHGAVRGISDLITRPGLINVDFADVRTVMSEMGMAMMGTGSAKGENRAREAAELAIASPLLENINLSGAQGVLVNITAGLDMSIGEFEEVGEVIKSLAADTATVVVGTVVDKEMTESGEMTVTVVMTGIGHKDEGIGGTGSQISESKKSDGTLDYHRLERPTVIRKQNLSAKPLIENTQDMEYLDIPAFLRRQEEEIS